MAEGGGPGLPREVPSVTVDRLFLELHDQLPKEAREKFAKLADEVKKLTEASTAGAPESQLPSVDQAVVRREEGAIAAKQSSADLPEQGNLTNALSSPLVDCNRGVSEEDGISS